MNIINTTLKDLIESSKPCIYALISPSSKKVMIRATKNLTNATNRLLNEYNKGLLVPQELENDIANSSLEIIALEDICDDVMQAIRIDYWVDYYLSIGYSLYKEHRRNRYRFKYRLEMVDGNTFQYKTMLYLENSSKSILIGIFDTIKDMNAFCNEYYPNKEIKSVVYHNHPYMKYYYKDKYYIGKYISKKQVEVELVPVED